MKKLLVAFLALFMLVPTAMAAYKPYTGELKNEVLEVKSVSKYNISIERKKLKPMTNVASYALCYEYIIKNDTNGNITLLNAESADRITPGGAFGRSQIPQKSDFVPVYGIIKGVKTDVELDRFTRPLPSNEIMRPGEQMRVLVLSPRKEKHVMTFNFIVGNKNVPITVQ